MRNIQPMPDLLPAEGRLSKCDEVILKLGLIQIKNTIHKGVQSQLTKEVHYIIKNEIGFHGVVFDIL